MKVLKETVPHAEIRNCARHIYANEKKVYGGKELKGIFWKILYATWQAQYEKELEELRAIDEATAISFMSKDKNVFCRAFISTLPKCESVDNNMAETFNGWICRARTMPIIEMLEEIRTALMERMKLKTDMIADTTDELCP